MSSRCRPARLLLVQALALGALLAGIPSAPARAAEDASAPPWPYAALRVCADPNNLPFSNARGEGFENRIAALLARDFGVPVEVTWWAQRRGFIRNTLNAGRCDVVPGLPMGVGMATTTRPYYRSTYVFVTRRDGADVASLDDPRLRTLTVGVQIIGNDHTSTPPAHALAARGITANVRGYSVYGDYAEPDPPARIVRAVADGEVDVALVWGPLAGYAAKSLPLRLTPVQPVIDRSLPMVFFVSMGVRHGDAAALEALNAALERNHDAIDAILADYGVPRLDSIGAPRPDSIGVPRWNRDGGP